MYLLFCIKDEFKNLNKIVFSTIALSEKNIFTTGKTIARLNNSNIIVIK